MFMLGEVMQTPYRKELGDFDATLSSHFAKLKSLRSSSPVFLIEHGLDERALAELRSLVGRNLRLLGVNKIAWSGNFLSLAVAITEVGYAYKGTGTDFWPKLDQDLNVSLGMRERSEVSTIFRWLSDRYGFAKPNRTDWSIAYTHIAWPIRNALAPIEIHRALTSALGEVLATGATVRDDGEFHRELVSLSEGLWSKRLRDWVEDAPTAVELCRKLLLGEDEPTWLDSGFAARIAKDLRTDPLTRNSLANAKRLATRERAPTRKKLAPSRYLLSVAGGKADRLLLNGPSLSEEERLALVSGLKTHCNIGIAGYKVAIALDKFLSGALVDLGQPPKLPEAPILALLAHETPPDSFQRMRDLLEPASPLAFQWDGTDGIFSAIDGRATVPADSQIILLTWSEIYREDGFKTIDAWPGVKAYAVNSSDPSARRLLFDLNLTKSKEPWLSLGGGAMLSRSSDRYSWIAGLPILCKVLATDVSLVLQTASGNIVDRNESSAGEVLSLDLTPDDYILTAETADGKQNFAISVLPSFYVERFRVELDPPSAQIDDLIADGLSFVIRSSLCLRSVGAQVRVLQGDYMLGQPVELELDAPGRLDAGSRVFKRLKETILDSCDSDFSGIEIELSLEGLGVYRWPLQQAARHYSLDPDAREWSDGEGRKLAGTLSATSGSPILFSSTLKKSPLDPGFSLLLPDVDDDRSLLCGVVTSPTSLKIGERGYPELMEVSRSPDDFQNRLGFQSLGVSYIAWRAAQPTNIFAERERYSICAALEAALVQQFCGSSWRSIEADGGGLVGNAHDALVRICMSRGISSGKRFPKLEADEKIKLRKGLFERLLLIAPNISDLIFEQSFEQLDFAIMSTYEEINTIRANMGNAVFDDPDIFNDDSLWRDAIEQALKEALIPAFQPLLLPTSRWVNLSGFDYKNSGLDDIVQALWNSHVDASRASGNRWLSRRELLSGLQLWANPRMLPVTSGWRSDLSKLLSDRQTSRAIRYAALRLRAETQSEIH